MAIFFQNQNFSNVKKQNEEKNYQESKMKFARSTNIFKP